jgi:hypothetical protein
MKTVHTFRLLMIGLLLIGPVLVVNAQVKEDDLIMYYSYNKDTLKGDEVIDVSGNKNDGLIKGKLKSVKGKVGEGMEFPGVATDYISVREHMYDKPIDEFSIAAWVKAPSRGMIASWDRSEFFRFAVGDDVGGNNGQTFVAFDTCCPCCHDWFGKTDVADDKWHHVAATFDGKENRIYVDGKLDEKIAAPAKVIGAGASRFGFIGIGSEAGAFDAATGPTWAYKGIMDEFMLYHRPLTEKEIEYLADGPADPFDVNPKDKLSTTWGYMKDIR